MIFHDNDNNKPDSERKRSRQYSAHVSFEIKFADFTILGNVCTDLAKMQFVSVRNIDWRLTNKTKASLVGMSRKLAVENAVAKARDYAAGVGNPWSLLWRSTQTQTAMAALLTCSAVHDYMVPGHYSLQTSHSILSPRKSCSIQVKFEARE
jgi:uncharacterized protein YggE